MANDATLRLTFQSLEAVHYNSDTLPELYN